MRLLLLGNLRAANSTENDFKHAFEQLGFTVDTVQEDDWINGKVKVREPDGDVMLVWVRTWPASTELVEAQLSAWKTAGIPIVGAHLDRFFGLIGRDDRQNKIYTDPYWRWLDWWFTADPCQEHWEAAIPATTVWMPPAVSTRNPLDVEPNPTRWDYDVVFVGNTDPDSYHPEHTHRFAMLAKLRARYGRRFAELPGKGKPRIVGADLTEIYRTVPVVVGDSCLVGLDRYHSDRVPETLGRQGFLLHPNCDWGGTYQPGVHLDTWRLGDWEHMFDRVDHALDNPEGRQLVAVQGQEHTIAHHTYTDRAHTIAETVLP